MKKSVIFFFIQKGNKQVQLEESQDRTKMKAKMEALLYSYKRKVCFQVT